VTLPCERAISRQIRIPSAVQPILGEVHTLEDEAALTQKPVDKLALQVGRLQRRRDR